MTLGLCECRANVELHYVTTLHCMVFQALFSVQHRQLPNAALHSHCGPARTSADQRKDGPQDQDRRLSLRVQGPNALADGLKLNVAGAFVDGSNLGISVVLLSQEPMQHLGSNIDFV